MVLSQRLTNTQWLLSTIFFSYRCQDLLFHILFLLSKQQYLFLEVRSIVQTFQPLLSSFEILVKQLLTAKLVVAASSSLPKGPTHGTL